MLDAKTLRTILSYAPETGLFTWLKRRNGVKSMTAGYTGCDGYVSIRINGKLYKAHRLAWFYVQGCWPSAHIDHINGDPSDNRLSNLREATHSENLRNVPIWGSNTSGYKGVSFSKVRNKWRAQIRFCNKRLTLGHFETPEDAYAAYCKAALIHHGSFANLGNSERAPRHRNVT